MFQTGWVTLWMRFLIPGEQWWEDNHKHSYSQGIHECSREASRATEISGDRGGRDLHQRHTEHWRWAAFLKDSEEMVVAS